MMRYQKENKAIKQQLEEDIKKYLAAGKQIEKVPVGKSTKIDVTNGWAEGFSIDDNVGFGRKLPRNKQ